ncbi:MAG: CNH domain-containing protein, partial [Olpidium bornovanus]
AQERHPDSRKLPIQSFLGRPTTRLGRYKLLLEAVLKFTAEDNQDQADIPAALKKVKSLLSQINVETGINDNRLRLSQLNDRLVLKNDEYRDLKLLDPERVMIREGVLKRADTVELTVFLLDNYLLLTKAKKGKDGQPEYRSHKPPIPLEMILLMEDPSPRLGLRRNSSMLFKPTFGNGGTAANGDADVDLSSVGDGRDGEKSLPAGHSRSLSAEISSGGAKQGYPFSLTRLGKSGGVITLYAKTLAEWRQWKEKIEKQVALLLKRTKIFSMKIVCQQGFAPVNRVLCAAVFGVANRLVVGTDDGLYVNGADEPQSFRRAIELERVSQVEVVEESSSVFALSRGELLSFDLDALEFHESTASKRPQRISSHVTFFRVGECLGRKLVCAVKSTSLSSTVKVMEPVVDSRYKKSTPGFAKLLMRGTNDNLKVFKEFYIPSEATSVDFLRKKLCVGCTKGFEIVDLDSLKTQGFLDPEDENLKFVADRVNVVPITIFRIDDSHFLLCYDLFAFYVDKTGHRAKGNWFIVWEGKPEAFGTFRRLRFFDRFPLPRGSVVLRNTCLVCAKKIAVLH